MIHEAVRLQKPRPAAIEANRMFQRSGWLVFKRFIAKRFCCQAQTGHSAQQNLPDAGVHNPRAAGGKEM